MERAIEIEFLYVFLIFEVPILGARMRGQEGFSFVDDFKKKKKKN